MYYKSYIVMQITEQKDQ